MIGQAFAFDEALEFDSGIGAAATDVTQLQAEIGIDLPAART